MNLEEIKKRLDRYYMGATDSCGQDVEKLIVEVERLQGELELVIAPQSEREKMLRDRAEKAEAEANDERINAEEWYLKAQELGAELSACKERMMELEEVLAGLLDGLDANGDERCGLLQSEWDKRVMVARQTLQAQEQTKEVEG
jgi:arginyl-tRNA synthetase